MSEGIEQNPYSVPTSTLQETTPSDTTLSIEQALSRGYDYSISDVISEGWTRLKGTKGIIICGLLLFYLALFAAQFLISLIFIPFSGSENLLLLALVPALASILASVCAYPVLAGVSLVGIRQAAGQPVSFNVLFSCFNRTVPLLITALLMTLLVYIGMLLLFFPGLYLAIAYMLAMPLVVERGLSPWQALEASRKAISQHWFKALGLYLLLGIIVAISVIPFGIGLIWSIPLFAVASGVLYRTIFGVLPVTE